MELIGRELLREDLRKATLAGKHWGSEGSIALAKLLKDRAMTGDEKRESYDALQSTHYTAYEHAALQAGMPRLAVKHAFWRTVAYFEIHRAKRYSDALVRLVGLHDLGHAELDVRQSILCELRDYEDAAACIDIALKKPDLTNESRALLHIGYADVQDSRGNHGSASEALIVARRIMYRDGVRPLTHARFHRANAQHIRRSKGDPDEALSELRTALGIATTNGLGDQATKIKAEIEVLCRK